LKINKKKRRKLKKTKASFILGRIISDDPDKDPL